MQIQNAKITQTFLGREDHGIPTFVLTLEWGDSAQGFGGMGEGRTTLSQLCDLCSAVSAGSWEELRNMYVRVRIDGGGVVDRIGHLTKDRWYDRNKRAIVKGGDE